MGIHFVQKRIIKNNVDPKGGTNNWVPNMNCAASMPDFFIPLFSYNSRAHNLAVCRCDAQAAWHTLPPFIKYKSAVVAR